MIDMTPEQIQLIQKSFSTLYSRREEFASLFYRQLFALDPTAEALFVYSDLSTQGRKLVDTLSKIVQALENLDSVRNDVISLGARHVAYGVRDEHYVLVGAALQTSLATMLGDEFTRELRDAWADAYSIITTIMQQGAHEPKLVRT